MPFLSELRHREPYAASAVLAARLADIHLLLASIRDLPIHLQLKKKMLNHGIWLVAEASGNFHSRFRSAGVLASIGVPIQRDHIHPRKVLVGELLQGASPSSVIERAQCCIVTKAEHALLSRVPGHVLGWDRYKEANVIVHDMQLGAQPGTPADPLAFASLRQAVG
ncbi:MAG: hypothetical protein NTW01_12200 [Gammaproteobacteria bacterium]|nr:hypothetical protein [Gammaproteobacteria bacterium]